MTALLQQKEEQIADLKARLAAPKQRDLDDKQAIAQLEEGIDGTVEMMVRLKSTSWVEFWNYPRGGSGDGTRAGGGVAGRGRRPYIAIMTALLEHLALHGSSGDLLVCLGLLRSCPVDLMTSFPSGSGLFDITCGWPLALALLHMHVEL